MPFNLTIQLKSNNIRSFLLYLTVLYMVLDKLYIIRKIINKCNHLIIFSLLKSPHINKIAQQHFGYKLYKRIVHIIGYSFLKFILWTKIFKTQLFTDVSLSLIYIINIKFIFTNYLGVYFNQKLSKFLNFLHLISIKALF